MGRFKISKQDTFIDMTPMSDVMVLLLTFFMLTATFVKEEPIKVNAPSSISKVMIPETNLLTIFVNNDGKVYLCMDTPKTQLAMIEEMCKRGLDITDAQKNDLAQAPTIGHPMSLIGTWLDQPAAKRNDFLQAKDAGIPCVPADEFNEGNDELKVWVAAAREANGEDMHIAIKADANTPYANIKRVMDSLRSIDESRYNLLTNLKGEED